MKGIRILLASALVVTSVFSIGIQKTYADATNHTLNDMKKATANSESQIVSLHGNCTTGYEWMYKVQDTSIAEVIQRKWISDDPTGTLCGSGQTQVWEITGLAPGTTDIEFNYLRPWEDEILERRIYSITVDSDLNVKITQSKRRLHPLETNIILNDYEFKGYEWKYEMDDDSIVKIEENRLLPHSSMNYDRWMVDALKEGETKITFYYINSKEGKVFKSSTYNITVDSYSDINITRENSSDYDNKMISLHGNQSTGCHWKNEIKDSSIAEITKKGSVRDSDSDGSGENSIWEIKGLKEGNTEVAFNYFDANETEIYKSVTYSINVGPTLYVTVEKPVLNPVNGEVSLHGNASTGYEWKYESKDDSIVKINEEDVVPDDPTGELDGSGETHIWTVKGLKEGSTEVTFNYLQPWVGEAIDSKTYVIDVDSNLNVTVNEKAKEEPEKPLITNLKVEESDDESSNQINPMISFENAGDEPLDLSKVKLKYYYTADGDEDETFVCYYAGTVSGEYKDLTSNVRGEIVKLTGEENKDNSDRCLEISFNGGVLDAGQSMSMQLSVHKDNWASYDRTNDYSYKNPDKIEIDK